MSFISEKMGTQSDLGREVGVTLCEAFIAADNGDFAKAVDLLQPIRYKIVNIGGSNAQVGLRQGNRKCMIKSSPNRHNDVSDKKNKS